MFNQCHARYSPLTFEKTLKLLKKKLPAPFPVRIKYVETLEKRGEFGTAELVDDKKFVITIDKTTCEDIAIDTLMHEWAHILSWTVGNNWKKWQEEHGPEFGVAYSRVYQVVYE